MRIQVLKFIVMKSQFFLRLFNFKRFLSVDHSQLYIDSLLDENKIIEFSKARTHIYIHQRLLFLQKNCVLELCKRMFKEDSVIN